MHLLGSPVSESWGVLIELKTENILIIAGSERAGLPNNPSFFFNAFTHLTAARCCEHTHVLACADTLVCACTSSGLRRRTWTHMPLQCQSPLCHRRYYTAICRCLLRGVCSPACLTVLDIPAALSQSAFSGAGITSDKKKSNLVQPITRLLTISLIWHTWFYSVTIVKPLKYI